MHAQKHFVFVDTCSRVYELRYVVQSSRAVKGNNMQTGDAQGKNDDNVTTLLCVLNPVFASIYY